MAAPEHLQETLDNLPTRPGCYLMFDVTGQVIYVGKAINLRARVRSYFHTGAMDLAVSGKTARLVAEIDCIEFIVTDSELEALILEAELIKKHRPRYNVRLKDDKRYPYIKVHWRDPYPKVTLTRRMERDGARYFGPFTSSLAVHQTLETLRKVFPYLTCDRVITGQDRRACLYYDIKLCNGPCIGAVSREQYRDTIAGLVRFLEGKSEGVVEDLKTRMQAAAAALDFEAAAALRDQIRALAHIVQKQKIVSSAQADQDVIAFAREDGDTCVQVFFIRGGKLLGREYFVLDGAEGENEAEIMSSFVKQFYDEAAFIPPEVILPAQIEEALIIEEWLRQKRGTKVMLTVPRRGHKRDLVQMAAENATETLTSLRAQWQADRHKQEQALSALQEALDLPTTPVRIECYDISTTQGAATVGSMVVFVHGVALKSDYRRFNVQSVQGQPDDYASMKEVLTRRLQRWQAASKGELAPDDPGAKARKQVAWALLPDLLLVDGGKGQLGVAIEVLKAFDLFGQVPVAGLAKQNEELFVPGRSDPILLPRSSQALFLVQRVRDEAHRFAITSHRTQRRKIGIASQLDQVPGVGPARRKALLKHFGSLEAIRAATVEEIAALPGIPFEVARAVKAHFGVSGERRQAWQIADASPDEI
jgi:excinuclease ABC subunit C